MAGGQMTAAQAAAAGVLGAGQARAQGQYQVGNIEANRILGAGQAWSQVPQQFAQGAFMGYGIQNPGAF
jgi:hypothetical protein